jgi:hypothetical protein
VTDFSLGIDPGAHLGLVVVRRAAPVDRGRFGYVVLRSATIKTPTEHTVAERLAEYRDSLRATFDVFAGTIGCARIEVPWRYGKKGLSIYTRGGGNVGSIGLLIAITGCAITVCHEHHIPVYEVPAPTGKLAAKWEKQKEWEAKSLTGTELKKHEAVACCLAIKGL